MAYFPRPFAVLRTLKSELMVGLKSCQPEAMSAEEPDWMVNGQRGIIQLVCEETPNPLHGGGMAFSQCDFSYPPASQGFPEGWQKATCVNHTGGFCVLSKELQYVEHIWGQKSASQALIVQNPP